MNLPSSITAPGWKFTTNEQDSVVSVQQVTTDASYRQGPCHIVVTTSSASETALAVKRRLDRAYREQVILYGAIGFVATAILLLVLGMVIGWWLFSAATLIILLPLIAGFVAGLWFSRSEDAVIPGVRVIGVSPEAEDLLFLHLAEPDRQALIAAAERESNDLVLQELAHMIAKRIRDDLDRAAQREQQQAHEAAAAIMSDAQATAAAILAEYRNGQFTDRHTE